jgi:hypothetical protein
VGSSIVDKIVQQTEALPVELQQRVLEFVAALTSAAPAGVPAERFLKFSGSIPKEDAEEMRLAIEQACEQVDPDEW